ncbi:MAG: hypothetical protein KF893_10795 [Caldilineaceae bacterium]|nr:hypothetical protein [Caldilineaceae bacterium]
MIESYPITLENFGLAALSDLFEDRVVYRSMQPLDRKLSGLKSARYRLGLNDGHTPRKLEDAYAKVALFILEEAQSQRRANLGEILIIGDTLSGDGQAFQNLSALSRLPGSAFICGEKADKPALQEADDERGIFTANRWTNLVDWLEWNLDRGLKLDKNTAVVVDMDKTAIGARGRNDRAIDAARLKGLYRAVDRVLGDNFNAKLFEQHYDSLNRARYHTITEDNQDYLAYICLALNAGLVECDDIMERMERASLNSFPHFVRWVDTLIMRGGVSESLRQVHEAVHTSVKIGDPTPFKSFRRQEFFATLESMNNLPDDVSPEERLNREITITEEVYEISRWLLDQGCLVLSLSDKPDEASLPQRPQQRDYSPIHRAQTHRVGVNLQDRLSRLR